jgi:hypothetical protein
MRGGLWWTWVKIDQRQRGKAPNRKSVVAFATIFRIIKGFMEASKVFYFFLFSICRLKITKTFAYEQKLLI